MSLIKSFLLGDPQPFLLGKEKGRKGITPVIATVLLLLMTVAAAGLAYQFVLGTQTDIQEGLRGQIERQQVESEARFQIDSVYNGGAPGNDLKVVLRNSGTYTYQTNELSVYLEGAPQTVTFVPVLPLVPKGTTTITMAGKYPIVVGNSVNIRIVPAIGTTVTYTCTNSGKNFC